MGVDRANWFTKDRIGAALLLMLGALVVYFGRRYSMGDLNHMGAGFVPVVLGVILLFIGGVLLAFSRSDQSDQTPEVPDLRGGLFILAGVFGFVLFGRYGGLVPATFATVFISAMGDRNNSLRDAALLAVALVLASALIFHWALGMDFPLFSWGA